MYDADDDSQFPRGAQAYAAYLNGTAASQPNYSWIVAKFPNACHLSITLNAADDADCLDVESGAASVSDVPGWYERQRAAGAERPVIYADASTMQAGIIVPLVRSGQIPRGSVRLWSAHYAGLHICGPSTCGAVSIAMDGTQWTSRAWGRNLDESALLADFFGAPAPGPPVVPAWQEAMMDALPELSEGASDAGLPHWYVRRAQACANAVFDTTLTIDGVFGAATKAAIMVIQQRSGIPATGTLDAATWEVLLAP